MSTRSFIAVKESDNKYRGIYCHHDGYPEHVGTILNKNYNDIDKINKLIDLGDISSLYENTDETQAYCRDYGEDWEDVKPKEFNKLIDLGNYATRCGAEYLYVFDDNAWAIRRT